MGSIELSFMEARMDISAQHTTLVLTVDILTLVNVYVDFVVFTCIAGTS